jgi:lysophospholipase L1-like esterase
MHRRTLIKAGLAGAAALATRPTHAAPLPYTPALVVCEGNSITDTLDYWVTPWYFHTQADARISVHAPVFVPVAITKRTILQLVERAPRMVYPLLDSWTGQKVVVLWEGINSLQAMRDARASWDAHAAYALALRRHGAQVIIGTTLPCIYQWDAGFGANEFEELQHEWNGYARAQWRDVADGLMDVAQDDLLSPAITPTNFLPDGAHPSDEGQKIIATHATDAILKLLQAQKPIQAQARPAGCLAFPFVAR